MQITFLDDSLRITQTEYGHYIFLGIGLLFALIGYLILIKLHKTFGGYTVMAFGTIFIVVGLLYWWNIHKITVEIHKRNEKVIIEENFGGEQLVSTLPYAYFSHIELMRKVSVTKSSSNKTSRSIRYEVILVGKNGISLGLVEFKHIDTAQVFVKRLQEYFPNREVFLIGDSDRDYETFIKTVQKQNPNFRLSDKYPIPLQKKSDKDKDVVALQMPQKQLLYATEEAGVKEFTWSNRSTWAGVVVLGMIVIAIFLLLHAGAIPEYGWNFGVIIGYLIGIFLTLIFLFSIFTALFGKYKLKISENEITAYTEILEKPWFRQTMRTENFASVRGYLTKQEAQGLMLFTKKGEGLMQSSIGQSTEKIVPQISDVVFDMNSYFLSIDVGALSISQRLFIIEVLQQEHKKISIIDS